MNRIPMKTKIVSLVKTADSADYIFGKGKNYVIPEYQREYSWEENQIESFVESLNKAINGESVFMGTVQFNLEDSELHIIDGQQRMTTFILLCSVLEELSGEDILNKNNMCLDIKNFISNNDKLRDALNAEGSNNRYIENKKLLKKALEELDNHKIDKIITGIFENIYFVELVTEGIPLPQVVGIFNTINTTGLDLNCSDLFKLQYYEYLKKNYPGEGNWMKRICDLYEEANKDGHNMEHILTAYKHCIVAKHGLKWEMLSKSNETFFEEIFGKKEPEERADILKFEEFEEIAKIYFDFRGKMYDKQTVNSFAEEVIWMTRYGRYWVLPYVAAYFNGKNYEAALKNAMSAAKYLVVCSVNFDKVINPVQTFMCDKILPILSRNEEIDETIQSIICETPYVGDRDKDSDWNKKEFKRRIKENLFDNGKRAYIVCTLSALLEEINEGKDVKDIKDRLFAWEKSKFDMEHICAQNIFNQSADSEDIPIYNGIGNLVVLERSINRSIGDKPVNKKVDRYEGSSFVSVRRVAEQIKESGNVWGIDQVSSRRKKQEKLLCEFLGLDD